MVLSTGTKRFRPASTSACRSSRYALRSHRPPGLAERLESRVELEGARGEDGHRIGNPKAGCRDAGDLLEYPEDCAQGEIPVPQDILFADPSSLGRQDVAPSHILDVDQIE